MSDRVDTEALAADLTAAEREALSWAIERDWHHRDDERDWDDTFAAVEAILAARDARVRADALAPVLEVWDFLGRGMGRANGGQWTADDWEDLADGTLSRLRTALTASSVGSGVGEGSL